jgi:hypothetical protein
MGLREIPGVAYSVNFFDEPIAQPRVDHIHRASEMAGQTC